MAISGENEMVMPVAPMYGGNNGGFGFGNDWGWIILLLLFAGGGWGNGFGGGFNNQLSYDFPWLMNGQNGINANTNNGFQNAMLNDNITSIRDGIAGLSTQLCNSFAGVEQGANARQIASMQTAFDMQNAINAGFNGVQSSLANCCCENRLATNDLKYTVATENCADRQALSEGVASIIASQNAGIQRVLDQMCNDKIDSKNDTINQLRQELLYARGQASQIEQTALLRQGQEAEVDALYNRLSNCPVPSTPVYGKTPIFTCGNNTGCCCGM